MSSVFAGKVSAFVLSALAILPVAVAANAGEVRCADPSGAYSVKLSYPQTTLRIGGRTLHLSTLTKSGAYVQSVNRNKTISFGLSTDGADVQYTVVFPDLDLARAFGESGEVEIYERRRLLGKISCRYAFSVLDALPAQDIGGFESLEAGPISDEEVRQRVEDAVNAELRSNTRAPTPVDYGRFAPRVEPLVVVHSADGYGSPITEYVPASRAPYGSEPVVVVRGEAYGAGPTTSYVPASRAPHGSEPVLVVRGVDGYGSPVTSYLPAHPRGPADYDRSCTATRCIPQ
jgi:hypothetical protein